MIFPSPVARPLHLRLFRFSPRSFALALLTAAGTCAAAPPAPQSATDLTILKVHGRWKDPALQFMGMGRAFFSTGQGTLAATDAWIAVGATKGIVRAGGVEEGAVQVFKASGAWVREILPPLPVKPGHLFGNSLAINGNLLVVGAPDNVTSGRVYIYDLTKGTLIKTLTPDGIGDGGKPGDRFGAAVAAEGDWIAVGAPYESNNRGSFYVFNTRTQTAYKRIPFDPQPNQYLGTSLAIEASRLAVGMPGYFQFRGIASVYHLPTGDEITALQPSSTTQGDQGGAAVALQGDWLVIGAPGTGANTGAIYAKRIGSNDPPRVFLASDGVPGRYLGSRLALNQGMLLAGAPNDAGDKGAAYVFDLDSTSIQQIRKLVNPQAHDSFMGFNVAWSGNTAVLAAPTDSDLAKVSGALILMRPVTRPAPMTKVAARGDYAPGVPAAYFDKLDEAFVNRDGEVAFSATLSGPGSNGGKDSGVWSSLAASGYLRLALKSRKDFLDKPTALVSKVYRPIPAQYNDALLLGTLTGPGASPYSNQGIYRDLGVGGAVPLFRTGRDRPVFANAVPQAFHEVRLNRYEELRLMGLTYTLRKGVASIQADNDSGVSLYSIEGGGAADTTLPREGSTIGATGKTHGQFATSRLAFYNLHAAYAGTIAGLPATNQGVFRKAYAQPETLVAQKGDVPAVPGDSAYSSFLGETVDAGGRVLFRATLAAPAVTTSNEGLWVDVAGARKLVFRKGTDLGTLIPELAGIRIAKFITYFMSEYIPVVLVQFIGSGVNAANDQGLLLYENENHISLLMREGDAAPGCNGARIGTISRVEFEPLFGQYMVLASLTGAAAGTDQALFRGYSQRLIEEGPERGLYPPGLALRKGWQFDGQPSRIKSISFSTSISASGAGNLGLGRVIQEATMSSQQRTEAIISVEFANGVRQLMKGKL